MAAAIDGAYAPWNFHWIVKGELAIMGWPNSEGNIRFLEKAGITQLVSLCPEKQPCLEYFPNHFRWTPIDILEFEPPTLEQMITFIQICKASLCLHEAVGVHCRMGRGRSGVMAACYLVYFYDFPPQNAVSQVRIISPGAIETYSQEKAVSTYHDHIRRCRTPSPDAEALAKISKVEIHPYSTVLQRHKEDGSGGGGEVQCLSREEEPDKPSAPAEG